MAMEIDHLNSPTTKDTLQNEQLARCLLMVARGGRTNSTSIQDKSMYKCVICDKGFSSYQALGGHKSSHRIRIRPSDINNIGKKKLLLSINSAGGRVHECSVCYKRFPTGQALGGHKRCHYEGTSGVTVTVSGVTSIDGEGSTVNYRNFDLNIPAAFPEEEEEVESPHPAKKLRLLFPVKSEQMMLTLLR